MARIVIMLYPAQLVEAKAGYSLSFRQASKTYGDDLHQNLEEQYLAKDESLILHYHKNCVSRYTSKSNLSKYQTKGCENPPTKKLRRSHETFDF